MLAFFQFVACLRLQLFLNDGVQHSISTEILKPIVEYMLRIITRLNFHCPGDYLPFKGDLSSQIFTKSKSLYAEFNKLNKYMKRVWAWGVLISGMQLVVQFLSPQKNVNK